MRKAGTAATAAGADLDCRVAGVGHELPPGRGCGGGRNRGAAPLVEYRCRRLGRGGARRRPGVTVGRCSPGREGLEPLGSGQPSPRLWVPIACASKRPSPMLRLRNHRCYRGGQGGKGKKIYIYINEWNEQGGSFAVVALV